MPHSLQRRENWLELSKLFCVASQTLCLIQKHKSVSYFPPLGLSLSAQAKSHPASSGPCSIPDRLPVPSHSSIGCHSIHMRPWYFWMAYLMPHRVEPEVLARVRKAHKVQTIPSFASFICPSNFSSLLSSHTSLVAFPKYTNLVPPASWLSVPLLRYAHSFFYYIFSWSLLPSLLVSL